MADMVTTELVIGVVVPKEDCPIPETAPASSANTVEFICCLGERVSDELLSEETST